MTRFHDLPIRQKLMALILVIATAALLLSGAGIVLVDSILFRGYLERDLATFARVIADNSIASLAFDDQKSAGEILGALRARPHIVAACLFRPGGARFAEYIRPGAPGRPCAMLSDRDESRYDAEALTVTRTVMLDGRRLGSLVIVYDLGEIGERKQVYGLTVLVVLIVSTLLVVLLSFKLRTMFVMPILELAGTAARVARTKDYTVRAEKLSHDEVGDLAVAFNEMLAGIDSRDADLRKSLAEREAALNRLAELNGQLRASNEELARSNQDLERFAFIASHDMQEPLRMVTIYSQLLVRQRGAESSEADAYRDYIVDGTRRMRDLLADLLTYVEITTSPRRPEAVDPCEAIEKVKENLTASIAESGAVVTADRLPVIEIHQAHAVSLFQNLIGNGLKYRSERPPEIRISVREVDGMYRFEVADNGLGIESEYHAKIFLAFTRLHGKSIPGTGIGLAICQRIVERYGGRIWVESEVGRGSTFIFTFPKPPAPAG